MKRVAVACAVALAAVLIPGVSSGALVNITIEDDQFVPANASFNFLESPSENVVWDWDQLNGGTDNDHNVVQKRGLFRSGNLKDSGTFELQASAGKYQYYCENHRAQGMKAKVNIIPAVDDITLDSVRVIWAVPESKTGKRFDVRYRVDGAGGGNWEIWKSQTRKRNLTFGGAQDKPIDFDLTMHDYEFSARSQKGQPSKRKRSGWSPPVLVE
jgi:plastocyanin